MGRTKRKHTNEGRRYPREASAMIPRFPKCSIRLKTFTTVEFSHLIVYLPKFVIPGGEGSYRIGHFLKVDMNHTFLGTHIDDFHLDLDAAARNGKSEVKLVYASLDGKRFYPGSLYARIRPCAKLEHVEAIIAELNAKLEMYLEDDRDDIGDEWCAQQMYRTYPELPTCSLAGLEHDRPLCSCQERFNPARVVDEMMPLGL